MTAGLRRWQARTLATLTLGYIGYYFCRSNLAVASPLLLEEFGPVGLDKARLGSVVAAGVLTYGVGKLLMGTLADFVGGRGVFLVGLVGSALATVAFGVASGLTVFTLAWCVSRFFQSGGWGALVKVAAQWFRPTAMGTVMGVLALSYPLGDFLAKLLLGQGVSFGLGWRGVFFVAAGVAVALAVVSAVGLRESPAIVGEIPPEASARTVFGAEAGTVRPAGLRELFGPLLRSPAFLCVCLMSFGLTVIREAFSFWTPLYLVESAGVAPGRAAALASVFPLFGGLSVLLAGWASDRWAGGRRAGVMTAFLAVTVLGIGGLSVLASGAGATASVALIALVGAAMTGPYAFLSGAVAVDLGGRVGPSTAAGVADAVGYVGSAFAGYAVGALAEGAGWPAAFRMLAGLAVLTALGAVAYGFLQERRPASPTR